MNLSFPERHDGSLSLGKIELAVSRSAKLDPRQRDMTFAPDKHFLAVTAHCETGNLPVDIKTGEFIHPYRLAHFHVPQPKHGGRVTTWSKTAKPLLVNAFSLSAQS